MLDRAAEGRDFLMHAHIGIDAGAQSPRRAGVRSFAQGRALGNLPLGGRSKTQYVISVPFLASALALTWEIGFFARIRGGSFGLFTLAEHLTFALQALPLALAVTSVAAMGLMCPGNI